MLLLLAWGLTFKMKVLATYLLIKNTFVHSKSGAYFPDYTLLLSVTVLVCIMQRVSIVRDSLCVDVIHTLINQDKSQTKEIHPINK